MKSLVIYFSRADENYGVGVVDKGNTEIIAEYINEFTGSDLFKVEPVKEYSKNYKECCDEALIEQKNNERPELKKYLDSIDNYDTIYIGCPIYWGTMPQCMFTCLERLNFNNKNIYVFTTHEGSGMGRVVEDIKKICSGSNIINTISIKGRDVYNSKDIIKNWLKK